MKKLTITALAGALLVLAGCMQAELDLLPVEEGIRITLNCGEIGTRTDYPEFLEGEANENLINSVDYFLFSSSGGDDYYRVRYSGHLEPKVAGDFTFYISTAVASLATGTNYKVFTIVNLPESKRIGSVNNGKFEWDASLNRDDLDGILLDETTTPTFTVVTENGGETLFEPAGKDLSLVMTGESEEFTVSDLEEATTVPVNLTRLPSKVTMEFYIKDRIVRNEKGVAETWTPMTDGANVRAYLCNGAKSLLVSGSVPSAEQDPDLSRRIFSYQPSVDNVAISSEKEGYTKAFRSEAFYSYPRQWSQGSKDEPYLKLIIPWKVRRVVDGVTTESQKEFYYKVMLPSELAKSELEDNGFESNHWYRLIVDVDRLGSATDDGAVTVQCEYAVLDWGDLQDFNLNMVQALYLDVNEGKYEVEFYGDKLELPFFSSGSVSYTVDNAYYNVFRTEAEYTYSRKTTSTSVLPATITTSTPINEWQLISNETVTVYTYSRNGQPTVKTTTLFNDWELIGTGYRYTRNGQPDIYSTTPSSQWNLDKSVSQCNAGDPSRWSPQTIVAAAQLNLSNPVRTVYEYTTSRSGALSPVVTSTFISNWVRTSTNPYTYTMDDENGNSVSVQTNTAYTNYRLKSTTYYYDVNDVDGNPVTITYTYQTTSNAYNTTPPTPSNNYNTTYYYDANDYSGNPITSTMDISNYTESPAYFYRATDEVGNPCIIMTGTNSYTNPSTSSRSVTIYNANGEDIRIANGSKSDYNDTPSNTSTFYETGDPHPFSGYDVSVSNEEKFLTIDHELKVDYSNRSYDVSPYIYEITLKLDGHEGEFDKKLKVTQYPSLYLDKVSSGYWGPDGNNQTSVETLFIRGYSFNLNGGSGASRLTPVGSLGTTGTNAITSLFLFANQNPGTSINVSNMNYFMGTLIKADQIKKGEGGNSNPNIFEVNATILQNFKLEINGASVDAVIGDPRVPEGTSGYKLPDGSSFDFSISGLHDNGQYRPTANDTQHIISPRFRVGSSFGRTRPMTYEGAMRRCAAYQENGYPAGRWRLPTMAEIQFVMRLYGDHKIDMLFDPDNVSAYWAGAGMARFGKGFILGEEVFVDMYLDPHVWKGNDITSPVTLKNSPYVVNNTGIRYDICEDAPPTSSSGTSTVSVYTRCVYDTWYWGDEQGKDLQGNPYSPQNPSWLGFQTAAPPTNSQP